MKSPSGGLEAEEIEDIDEISTCPGTWIILGKGIRMPGK